MHFVSVICGLAAASPAQTSLVTSQLAKPDSNSSFLALSSLPTMFDHFTVHSLITGQERMIDMRDWFTPSTGENWNALKIRDKGDES